MKHFPARYLPLIKKDYPNYHFRVYPENHSLTVNNKERTLVYYISYKHVSYENIVSVIKYNHYKHTVAPLSPNKTIQNFFPSRVKNANLHYIIDILIDIINLKPIKIFDDMKELKEVFSEYYYEYNGKMYAISTFIPHCENTVDQVGEWEDLCDTYKKILVQDNDIYDEDILSNRLNSILRFVSSILIYDRFLNNVDELNLEKVAKLRLSWGEFDNNIISKTGNSIKFSRRNGNTWYSYFNINTNNNFIKDFKVVESMVIWNYIIDDLNL